jgi:two-component system phosphate regulon response regulator PhoB
MARVLVVEDDAELRLLLANALQHVGHTAMLAGTGRAGLEIARSTNPDLLLLDLNLPDLQGAQMVRALKADATTARTPIIILTARAGEADRIQGLELGAEDYVTKPFSLKELLLRTAIVLRRNAPSDPAPALVQCSSVRMDLLRRRVFVKEQELTLTPIEFRLLATLAARAGLVQSREVLLTDVWGAAPDLETRTVDAHVKRLREKLGSAADCLETVRGIGYRFRDRTPAIPVAPVPEDPLAPVAGAGSAGVGRPGVGVPVSVRVPNSEEGGEPGDPMLASGALR